MIETKCSLVKAVIPKAQRGCDMRDPKHCLSGQERRTKNEARQEPLNSYLDGAAIQKI